MIIIVANSETTTGTKYETNTMFYCWLVFFCITISICTLLMPRVLDVKNGKTDVDIVTNDGTRLAKKGTVVGSSSKTIDTKGTSGTGGISKEHELTIKELKAENDKLKAELKGL